MSFSPEKSAIKLTKSLEEQIQGAISVSQIQAILHQAAQDQHLIEPDPFDRIGNDYFSMRPVEPGSAAAAKGFGKTLVINGTKHILEAATEQELASNELALMRQLFADGTASATQARDEAGRFVTEQQSIEVDARRIAELIPPDPITDVENAIVERALAAKGISIATLQKFEGQNIADAWSNAVRDFKETPEGSTWTGGDANLATMQRLIVENNLSDQPSAETLGKVWAHMKQHGLVAENPELVQAQKTTAAIANAQDYESLKAAVGYRDPDPRSSGMWGR